MSAFYVHRQGEYATAVCRSPRCRFAVTWRGATDQPPVTARNAIRGHECQPRGGVR